MTEFNISPKSPHFTWLHVCCIILYYPSFSPLPVHVAAVFFVTVLMFGLNIWAAAVLMMVVCMIILHMFGCMHLLGINANAVSLVNLVMVSRLPPKPATH